MLEALRSQTKLPGQASMPPSSPQQPSAADGGGGGGSAAAAAASGGAGPSGSSSGGGRPPTGLSGSFAQLFPQQPPANSAKGGSHQSSIYHSPFAAHPRSKVALPGGAKGGGVNGMPPLPSSSGKAEGLVPQVCLPFSLHTRPFTHSKQSDHHPEWAVFQGRRSTAHSNNCGAAQVPNTPVPRGAMGGRTRSTNDSTMSGRDEGDVPACFSGESNDSHAEHQVLLLSQLPLRISEETSTCKPVLTILPCATPSCIHGSRAKPRLSSSRELPCVAMPAGGSIAGRLAQQEVQLL